MSNSTYLIVHTLHYLHKLNILQIQFNHSISSCVFFEHELDVFFARMFVVSLVVLRVSSTVVVKFRRSNTVADDFSLPVVAFLGDTLVGTSFQND